MARTRPAAPKLVVAFGVGAMLGLVAWLDQQLIGGVDYAAQIQSLPPVRGFLWNTVGCGGLAVVAYLVYLGLIELGRRPDRTDPAHANHCMLHWPRYHSTHQCTCDADARNWSPERRRQAFRTITGGRL